MLLSELLRDVPVIGEYKDVQVTDVTDNTDKVAVGCAFVCIKGKRFDGHDVAERLLSDEASVVICERDLGLQSQVLVPDTRAAYALMCKNFFGRACDRMTLIGITGTNGKTTTAFIIKDLLKSFGLKSGLIGTVKNMIGEESYPTSLTTPDPYELHAFFKRIADKGVRYCVMEASSQALHQRRLEGIHFRVGVLTNITQDHLDYHGTMEEYIKAKRILFAQSDIAVLNADDRNMNAMLGGRGDMTLTYSAQCLSDIRATNIEYSPSGVSYIMNFDSKRIPVRFGIPGSFSVYNSLAAAGACRALGYDMPEVANNLQSAQPVTGRIELLNTATPYSVIIDYAHTPDGIEKALSAVKGFTKGRVIAVFGCGGDRDAGKRPKMGAAAASLADFCVVTSDNPRTENPSVIIEQIVSGIPDDYKSYNVIKDRTQAIEFALSAAKKGDAVVLLGKGHETYQIIGTEKRHYDEREIVAKALEAKK